MSFGGGNSGGGTQVQTVNPYKPAEEDILIIEPDLIKVYQKLVTYMDKV